MTGWNASIAVVLTVAAMAGGRPSRAQGNGAGKAVAQVQRAELPQNARVLPVEASGRVARLSGGMYRFQWPGTHFAMAYRGSALYWTVGPGDLDIHLSVDGQSLPALLKPAPGVYRIQNATAGDHTVRLDVVNENQDGPKTLGDFRIAPDAEALAAPAQPRQIEFIGDSHTVGYGNMSPSRQCTAAQIFAFTDNSHAYGPVMAMHYGADYRVNAISGRGVVRNYDGAAGDTVPVAYPFLLFDRQTRYHDAAWHPRVIVLSLGTNDFSTPLKLGEPWKDRAALHADYERNYVQLVQGLRKNNPAALIVLWATDSLNGETATEEGNVVQQLRAAGDHNVDFAVVAGLGFTACDWHPSSADDATIAARLTAIVDGHHVGW